MEDFYDVLIVGAGMAGINAAYRVQTQFPKFTYQVLERRNEIGGTWSFFKYPGLRSDSELFSLGFAWELWKKSNPIAEAASILDYIRHATRKHGIDKKIQFGYEVTDYDWSSEQQRWNVKAKAMADGHEVSVSARFVVVSTGYYDYREPLKASIPGVDGFSGDVVHPQFWPEDLDYKDKRVAIVGSGATTVTLVPAIAKQASKVTMIQRSPSYIHNMATKSLFDSFVQKWLPETWASFILRWKYVILAVLFYYSAKKWPETLNEAFAKSTRDLLPEHIPYDPHFKPKYNLWDQRVCIAPDGDFFDVLQSGKADVKTGVIRSIEGSSIVLESGEEVEADVLVTATGLKLQVLGGAKMTIDGGPPVEVDDKFMWRGTMLQDVPNAVVTISYFNVSWTQSADLAVNIFLTNIRNASAKGMTSFTPRIDPIEEKGMPVIPLWNLLSTYVRTGDQVYPKASDVAPWNAKDRYMREWWAWKRNDLFKGIEFGKAPLAADRKTK